MKLLLKHFLLGKNKPGVAYIELLISFAIIGVVGLLLAVAIVTSSRLFSDQKTTTHISTQNRIALDEMTNQIRSAVAVADCPAPRCDTIDVTSTNSRLVLQLWPIDSNENPFEPTDETELDYIVYKRSDSDNTKLIKQTYESPVSNRIGGEKILSSEVSTDISIIILQFDYYPSLIDATKVTITLSNADSSIHRDHTITQTSVATLRNKTFVQNPIQFDAASSAAGGASTSSYNWQHTVGPGSNRILVVGVSIRAGSFIEASSVTFNGNSLTRISNAEGITLRTEQWYLVNPDNDASHTIEVTLSGSPDGSVGGATSWTGVDTDNPIRNYNSAFAFSNNPTVDVPSESGDMVVDTAVIPNLITDDPSFPLSGQTEQWNTWSSGATLGLGSSELATGSVTTMSWTTKNEAWKISAVSLRNLLDLPPTTECSDGIDNADPEDTLIDLADPGCTDANDDDETDPFTLVSCSPSNQSREVDEIANLSAADGDLTYSWSAPPDGNLSSTTGTPITVSYPTIGTKTVTVSSDGNTDDCTVDVTAIPPVGSVGLWHLDGTALDASGNGNNGTLQGGMVCSVGGRISLACSFDGSNDYITVPHSASTNIAGSFTLEMWIDTDMTTQGWMLTKFGSSNVGGYGIGVLGNGVVRFTTNNGGWDDFDSIATVNDGFWHHVAVVYDGTQKLIYIDGSPDGNKPYSGTITTNTDGLNIGKNTGGGGYFNGTIDEASIWDGALNASEIQDLFNLPPPLTECSDGGDNADPEDTLVDLADPGCTDANDDDETDSLPTTECSDGIDNADPEDTLIDLADPGCSYANDDDETDPPSGFVGLWRLNTNADDSSGNGYNGTLLGDTFCSVASLFGSACSFDGSGDYINLGNPSLFPSGTSARSMCAWAKTNTIGGGFRWIAAYGSPANSQAMFLGQNGATLYGGGYGNDLTVASFWDTTDWHHVCLTYDGATARLYGDGSLLTSAAKTWSLVKFRAYIGLQVNNNEPWNGLLDEVGIWNRALILSEIQGLYNQAP